MNDNLEKRILSIIPEGRDNAISMRRACDVLEIEPRILRSQILEARLRGAIICGDNSGYYTPKDATEALAYYKYQHTRAISTLRSLKACRKMLIKNGIDLTGGKGTA